nr:S8 family serine peptidase [Bacteroidota bacterium]
MKKNFLLLCILNVSFFLVNAKELTLKLKSGNLKVSESALAIPTNQVWKDYKYFVIQFNQTPSLVAQQQLKQSGLILMDYLPDYAYYAAVNSSFNVTSLVNANVHAFVAMSDRIKMHPSIINHDYPSHALRGNNSIELTLKLYNNIDAEEVKNFLELSNVQVIQANNDYKVASVIVSINDIGKIASLPFIQYVEPIGPVGEPENYYELGSHRTNAISTEYAGGRKYNGAGVTVGIGDDGWVGPHIDYTGRLDITQAASAGGDHGDHCSGILMGAGNLDPKEKGQAWGSFLYSYDYPDNLNNADFGHDNFNIRVTSSSYSDGCNAGYTAFSQQCDIQTRNHPELIHSFSAGNQGGNNCGYYNGGAYGNITGGHKIGKNVITASALDANDAITGFSSRGPTQDGRTAPKVSAVGSDVMSTLPPNTYGPNSGTSMSCPAVSGTLAQLNQCYKDNNANVNPPSALIKAIMMNSCDDLGNPGPDFVFGYGRINAYRAAIDIENAQYFNGTLSQGDSTEFTLTVPSNVGQLKVMLYWHDYEAAIAAAPALVNDLDLTVVYNSFNTYLPLVPDPTPVLANLSANAVPNVDHMNNEEQVYVNLPSPGTYTFKVAGFNVPQGAQEFYVVYDYVYDEITVTYPLGGESMEPNELQKIRWDAYGNAGTFTVSYSTDSGATYNVISSTVAGNRRYLDWTTPSIQTGKCLVKVERNGLLDVSEAPFSIMDVPTNLQIAFSCPDSIKLTWNAVANAVFYEASVLGAQYMDSMGTNVNTEYVYTGLNPFAVNWFSVKAYGPNDAVGRRAIAISSVPGISNCVVAVDAGISAVSPSGGNLYSCASSGNVAVTADIKNEGLSPITNFDVAYILDNGSPVVETFTGTINPGAMATHTFTNLINISAPGAHSILAYVVLTNDGNGFNDTLAASVTMINAPAAIGLPYIEDFETFAPCGTDFDCEVTICFLGNDLVNEENLVSDDIDWRTNFGPTPSQGTGPDVDHTLGTAAGQYVYTEASNGCFGKIANMVTPCINLTGTTNPVLSFYYHMFGADMGDLHIDIFANDSWINDVVPAISGNQPNQWILQNVGLSNYIGQIVNLRFRGVTGPDFASDLALDDIGVAELTGINDDIIQASNFNLNPNPTNGEFQLSLAGAQRGLYDLSVFDATGKLVFAQSINNQNTLMVHQINLTKVDKGVYHLRLIHNGTIYNETLVKY